jgi:capsular polysaccharide biosynthesis protein
MPERRLVRVTAVGALAGALLGVVLASATGGGYRAHATVMVAPALRQSGADLATTTATAAGYARSASVLDNVTQALKLGRGSLAGKVHVHPRPGTALIDLAVDQPTAQRAERAAQQLVVVFTAVAGSRFPSSGGQAIVGVDTPGGTARPLGRPYVWFAILGALLVALLSATAVVLGAGRPRPVRARKPSVRPAAQPEPVRAQQPAPAPAPPAPAVERVSEPVPVPAPRPAPAAHGRVHIEELERIAAAEPDPARAEEQRLYVEQLREFATADGTLPAQFEPIVDDVFGWIAPRP